MVKPRVDVFYGLYHALPAGPLHGLLRAYTDETTQNIIIPTIIRDAQYCAVVLHAKFKAISGELSTELLEQCYNSLLQHYIIHLNPQWRIISP